MRCGMCGGQSAVSECVPCVYVCVRVCTFVCVFAFYIISAGFDVWTVCPAMRYCAAFPATTTTTATITTAHTNSFPIGGCGARGGRLNLHTRPAVSVCPYSEWHRLMAVWTRLDTSGHAPRAYANESETATRDHLSPALLRFPFFFRFPSCSEAFVYRHIHVHIFIPAAGWKKTRTKTEERERERE